MLRRMMPTPGGGAFLFVSVVAWGLVGCGPAAGRPWGYRFWPDVETGSVTFVSADGTPDEYPIVSP